MISLHCITVIIYFDKIFKYINDVFEKADHEVLIIPTKLP